MEGEIKMGKKNNINYLPLFASSPYYSKKEFQFPITAVNKTVANTSVLKNNSGITLLYVRGGQGKIIINTREYPVQRGLLMVLGTYHYYQVQPDEIPLEITKCRLSYDTFLYMAANPYYRLYELRLNVDPISCLLDGRMLIRTEQVLDELVAVTAKHKHQGGETEFFLCMKLMGIMQKTHNNDLWK